MRVAPPLDECLALPVGARYLGELRRERYRPPAELERYLRSRTHGQREGAHAAG